MRTNLLVVALLVCVHLPVKSSAQAVQGGGPTLAETMAFLNEKLQERGAILYASLPLGDRPRIYTVISEGFSGTGCEQTYRRVIEGHRSREIDGQDTTLAILRLDQADASSVAILEPEQDSTGSKVSVGKIAYAAQDGVRPHPGVEFDLHDSFQEAESGPVQSVDIKSLTFRPYISGEAAVSGTPRRLTPDNSVKFYLDFPVAEEKHPRAKLADIVPGDILFVLVKKSEADVYIKKIPGAVAPLFPDPEAILPATRQVGPERKQFIFGYSKDREDAEHIAKAMIHEIVLCQANAKKDLF